MERHSLLDLEWRTNAKGYGLFHPNSNQTISSHIYAWKIENGPMPKGKELDHLCRNHSCVRHNHLEPVLHQVNCIRGLAGTSPGSHLYNRQKTHCIHGHEYSKENTGIRPDKRRYCLTCLRLRHYKKRRTTTRI